MEGKKMKTHYDRRIELNKSAGIALCGTPNPKIVSLHIKEITCKRCQKIMIKKHIDEYIEVPNEKVKEQVIDWIANEGESK